MNIFANLKGCLAVLLGKLGWEDFFELNRGGVFKSFFGLLLILPSFYFIAYILQSKKNSNNYDSFFEVLPFTSITIILFLYLLSFSAMALIVVMVFDFQDRLRPWLITRHWCIVWLSIFVGAVFYFHSLGLIPFYLTNFVALLGFLTILIIDIFLAKSILFFKNGTAIVTGCGINLVGLSIILTSLN